jgi:serine/threonine-protein kinase
VHRDLKPANIMLEPSGRVVVLDFGVSTWASRKTATETRGSLNTPQYMAPEQFLGVVAFEVLTGSLTFEAENVVAYALKHTEELPPNPLELRPEPSPRLAAVVLRCLEKKPRDRFESAGAVGALV